MSHLKKKKLPVSLLELGKGGSCGHDEVSIVTAYNLEKIHHMSTCLVNIYTSDRLYGSRCFVFFETRGVCTSIMPWMRMMFIRSFALCPFQF